MRTRLFAAVFAALLLFMGCSKKSDPPTPASTDLKIVFTDASGSRVSGASVSLYATQANYFIETSALRTTTTDAQGQAIFTGLASARYWWLGKKDCLNNANSTTSTSTAIPSGQTSVISAVMQSTGTLRFTNTSANPYRVYINGVAISDQPGGTTVNLSYQLAGSYTLRVLQLSGYAVTPTDRTYTGTLTCNGVLTTTYP